MAPIPRTDTCLYGAVDVFLKRSDISARRASESCSIDNAARFYGPRTYAASFGRFVGGRRHRLSTAEVNSMPMKMLKDR
jgi:hypothetical protein